jgi:hypothetical protein
MYAQISKWLATKGESLYAVIAGRIERVTNRNVNQVLGSGNKVIIAPTSKVAGQIAKQDKIPAGQLLTPAKQEAALKALKKSRDAQAAAGKKIAEATKQAQKKVAKKAEKARVKKAAAEKKAQAAKDSKAARESEVSTVVPSKARLMTAREIEKSKNLPALIKQIRQGKVKASKGDTAGQAVVAAIMGGAGIAALMSLRDPEGTTKGQPRDIRPTTAKAMDARREKDTAQTTSDVKGDHPGDPKPESIGAKAKPKKEQATNAQLSKYYDNIEKIREGAVTGETVTFDKKTYGGATGPAWQEYSRAWEKKYKKPEDPIKSFFKGVKKKITGEKKRGGGQVSRRPVKYSTMKKMYSHGGPVRKPKRI